MIRDGLWKREREKKKQRNLAICMMNTNQYEGIESQQVSKIRQTLYKDVLGIFLSLSLSKLIPNLYIPTKLQ